MSLSLALWIGAATALFWSVGAYNRLMRLRSEAIAAFAALETLLQRQVELTRGSLPASAEPSGLTRPGDLLDGVVVLWAGLRGAAMQLSASLLAMRPRPLDPCVAAALAEAQDVFAMAWQRLHQDAHDLAGAPLPDALWLQWQHLALQTGVARQDFNDAVGRYNAAIVQFPALLLAWLFGFKSARPI